MLQTTNLKTNELKINEYIVNDEDIKIMTLSTITGLSEYFIKKSFENTPQNISVVEKLVDGFNKMYDFSEYDNNTSQMFNFVFNISGISKHFLISIRANQKEFYNNITLRESLTIILTKMIDHDNDTPSKNGFPASFNFIQGQQNSILRLSNGKLWYPYINNGFPSCGRLINDILNKLNIIDTDNLKLLYHGTSWRCAADIMKKIKATTRGTCSDFGLYNFYTTDVFFTACEWAYRKNQGAVVIFAIPDDQFYEWNVKNLSDTLEWKNIVFNLRNPPDPFNTDNYELISQEYDNLVEEIDSYDVIEGPILSNPGAKTIEQVEFIRNNDRRIPYQFSFKPSSVNSLNPFLLATVFFSQI